MTVVRSGADLRSERTETGFVADAAEGETLVNRSEDGPQGGRAAAVEPRKAASLTPQVRDRIASQLRAMYASVATQPVPDRFADLIARLDPEDRDRS